MEADLLSKLNSEQKEAVTYDRGPLLIVAGAGTGKTTVLTHRIAYLIREKGIKPEEILAVTFTEKAAREMEERVEKLLPFGYYDFWISTFHSFCDRILKRYGLSIGISTNYKLLEQTGSWVLIKKNFDKFSFLKEYRPLGNPTKFIEALVSHFGHCKNEGIYPENYLEHADFLKADIENIPFIAKSIKGKASKDIDNRPKEYEMIKEVAEAYSVYQKLLLDNNLMDFGDLINYTLKLFEKRPEILEKQRKQFKYIMVDEFQDTNWVQYELVQKLAYPENNIMILLDDDQAIMNFQGASFNNALRFKQDYPKSEQIALIENYRSPQNILDLAYQFIQLNNPNRLEYQLNEVVGINKRAKERGIDLKSFKSIDKKLKSNQTKTGAIELLGFESLDDEVSGVINKIWELKEIDDKAEFADFAILTRTNDSANSFCRALERAGIPYQFVSSKGLYTNPLILDLISYLKVVLNFYDSPNFYRVLRMMDFSPEEVSRIIQYSDKKGIPIFEAINDKYLLGKFTSDVTVKLKKIVDNLKKHYKLSKDKNASEVFIHVINDLEYGKYLPENSEESLKKWEMIDQFFEKMKSFENSQNDSGLLYYMENLQMELEAGEEGSIKANIDSSFDAVRVMTVHSSKGLEFKYVFLTNLVSRKFPSDQKRNPIEIPEALIKEVLPEGDFHIQEERRLFYVALTRAKRGLFLTWAADYGGKDLKKPSRFLIESGLIDEEVLNKQKFTRSSGFCIKRSIGFKLESNETNESGRDLRVFLPDHFSYSQLESFRKCPLEYKFRSIFRIPMRGKSVFSFGKSIHQTLHRFVLESLKTSAVDQKDLFGKKAELGVLSFKDLLNIYEKEWISDWYESATVKKEFYEKGKESLKLFYDDFVKNKAEVLFINDEPALEKNFNLKINGDVFIGTIDRIDKLAAGVEIIDYKTGSPKKTLAKDEKLQLLIYAVAAKKVLGLHPIKLSYYYLDDGSFCSFNVSDDDIEDTEKQIKDLLDKIKRSNFKPSPGWHCQYCDFKDICAHRKV
ncbi:MAG: UvrD-helicase domain-containing protein [Candidatus Paceibacterota bacterium]|jgi:DNA helicase-2/ATP-dependent DNA helicase PcrA